MSSSTSRSTSASKVWGWFERPRQLPKQLRLVGTTQPRSFGCGLAALRCIAGFQTRRLHDIERHADLEIGDTAGLETCATKAAAVRFGLSAGFSEMNH